MNSKQNDINAAMQFAVVVAQVPENMRDVVAAQLMGTVNGVLIAASIDQNQKTA